MNKKVKKPQFAYPFKDSEQEEASKRFVVKRQNMISDRGSRVELTETDYKGGWYKLELKETIYIEGDSNKKLSELLYLRPYDQVRMKKLLDFVVSINEDGKAFLTRKECADRPLEFTSDQRAIIHLFYEHRSMTLEDAIRILGTYKNTESLRQTIHKMNRRIVSCFKLTEKDEFIKGNFYKNRDGYSFNPNIRLEFLDDRIMTD
jgi:hypothetical protein